MSRLSEIVSLTLDVVFKLGGFVVFIAQGLGDRAGERPITLIISAILMGLGEFLPVSVLDILSRRKGGGRE